MAARSPEALENQRKAKLAHYHANKQAYIDRAILARKALAAEVRRLKESVPCTDCNLRFPYYVMDFDHLGDKVDGISRLIVRSSRKKVFEEIDKCELVCANCHRVRTFSRGSSAAQTPEHIPV